MTFSRKQLWMSSRDYIMITLATLIFGFGFSAFILPEKVVIGGVTGLGTIVYFLTGNPYMIGISQYFINIVLLLIAWRVLGRAFVYKTLYGAMAISFVVTVMPPLFDGPLVPGQPFMNVCIGAVLSGIALGMVFTHNGSTGGTDVVAAIVSKKTNVTVGRTILYVDFAIISSSYLLFHDITRVVYGFIVLFFQTYMVDLIINSNRQAVQFMIISKRWEHIANAVNKYARRGVTVLDGKGWYSKQPVKLLMIVCRKMEAVTIFRIVKDLDKDAFITQANVNGAYGQGFDQIKYKSDNELSKRLEEETHKDLEASQSPELEQSAVATEQH